MMTSNRTVIIYGGELYHHGVKGQKWGVRRFQNPDGTLTEEGQKRYGARQDRIKKNEDKIRKENKKLAAQQRELRDLNKYGTKSKVFDRDIHSYDSYNSFYDKETGHAHGRKEKVYAHVDQPDMEFKSKREALEYAKQNLKDSMTEGKKRVDSLKKENDVLLKAPITSRTFLENEKIGKRAFVGITAGTTVAGTVRGAAGLGFAGANIFLLPSALLGASLGLAAESKISNIGVAKEYRK